MRVLVKVGEMRFHHLHVHPKVFFSRFGGTVRVLLLIQRNTEHSHSWFSWNDARLLETLPKRVLWKFLLAACVCIQVKAADSGPRKSTQCKNGYHCCVFWTVQRVRSHSSCSIYSQLNEELCVTLAFTSWQNKPPSSPALKSPGGIGTGDAFLLWLLHTSPPPCRTPECYHTIKWRLTGTALRLIWSRNTRWSLFLNYAADPDIFTLMPVFWRFPLAFEYSSVFLLSLIPAAKPAAWSLDSASNIYVEHEHPEQPDCERHVEAVHHRRGFGTKRYCCG